MYAIARRYKYVAITKDWKKSQAIAYSRNVIIVLSAKQLD